MERNPFSQAPEEEVNPFAQPPEEEGNPFARPVEEAPTGFSARLAPEQFKSGLAGMQQSYYASAARNNAAILNVLDRIDRGEEVPPIEDVLGYAEMNAKQRKEARDGLQSALTASTAKVIAYGAEREGYEKNPNAEKMIQLADEREYRKAWEVFKSDPTGIIQQLSVESAPNMLPSLVTGAMGYVLRGGLSAFMVGMAGGSFPVEFNAAVMDSLQESGIDLKDPKAVEAKLKDPEFIEAAGKKAVTRASVISAADAASGSLVMPFKAGQLGRNVARGAANVVTEPALEMAGEAAAQAASGEDFKVGQILAEGLGAVPQAAAITGIKTAGQAYTDKVQQQKIEEIRSLTDTSRINPEGDLDQQFSDLSNQYQTKLSKENADELALRTLETRQKAEADAKALGATLPTDIVPDPERVQMLEESFVSTGIPPELARVEAVTQATEEAYGDWIGNWSAAQEEQKTKAAGTAPATGEPDPKRVEQIVDDLTTAGVPLAEAQTAAVAQATAEAKRAAAQGAQDVGRPLDQPSGTSVQVAGQPPAGPPTPGAAGTEPFSVASFTAGLGQPAGGTGTPSDALTEETEGETLGTEAPEAVEAKKEGQEKGAGKPLGPIQTAKKLAQDAFAEQPGEGVNKYEAREAAFRRARAQVKDTGNKAALAFFDREVAKLRKKIDDFDPVGFTKASARGAFDEGNIDDVFDNLNDTLTEYGITDPYLRSELDILFNAELYRLQQAAPKGKRPVKLSLSNERFSKVPIVDKLYRASTEQTRYPGKFWTAIKELAERYAKKSTGTEQRTVTETEGFRSGRQVLNITTVSQLSKEDRQKLLADFRSWLVNTSLKTGTDINIEDTYLFEVLENGESDFIYPTPYDVQYLKYKGYKAVYFAKEGGETVDTWFVFDKRERAAKAEDQADTEAIVKEKRKRGRPAKTGEEKAEGEATAKTNRAKANRDNRTIKNAVVLLGRAKNLGLDGKTLRNDALHMLYDVYSTAVFTPQKTRAKEVLDAQKVTQADLDALKSSHAEWKVDFANRKKAEEEKAQKAKAEREEKRAKRAEAKAAAPAAPAVPKEKKAPGRPKLTQEELDRREEEKKKKAEARQKAKAEQAAVRSKQIAFSLQDKLKKLAKKVLTLSNRVVTLTKNKPKVAGEPGSIENDKFAIWELKHKIATKQNKLAQIEVKLAKEETVDWDVDWEKDTAVKGINAATKEIDGLQATLKQKQEELAAKEKEAKEGKAAKGKVKPTTAAPVAPATQPATEATPQAQFESLVAGIPGAPTYDSLSPVAKKQIDDLAKRGVLNLSAVNLIVSNDAALQAQAQIVKGPIEPVDPAFKGFKTATEALNHIRKTGNPFQRFLAWRIASAIKKRGTKFVVVEATDPVPNVLSTFSNLVMWNGAFGVYVPFNNTIYIKGESFGRRQGINNKTVLHELLHAATYWKIRSARMAVAAGKKTDTQVVKVIADLTSLMLQAKDHYLALERDKKLDEVTANFINSFIDVNEDGVVRYELFSNQDEFLAHGLSSPRFMEFLKKAPGFQNRGTLRSWFVDIARRLLGLPPKYRSALADLMDINDRIISAKPILTYDLRPAPTPAAVLMSQVPTPPPTPPTPPVAQTTKKVRQKKQRVNKALAKAQRSNYTSKTFFDGLRELVEDRDPTLVVDVLSSKFAALRGEARRQLLPMLSRQVLVDWATRLGIKNIGTADSLIKDMEMMRNKLKADAAPIGDALLKLQRKDPDMYSTLAAVMHYATLRGLDPANEEVRKKSGAAKQAWEKLTPEAQRLYTQVRDYYAANYDRYYQHLTDTINSFALEGDPNDASTPKGNLLASIRRLQETGKRINPYFPLMRYGQFWVRIGKGKSGKFYMFESQSDKELFLKQWIREEQKRDPKADLEKLRLDGVVDSGNSIKTAREQLSNYNDVVKRMFENIDGMKVDTLTDDFGNDLPKYTKINKDELKDDIYQLILHTMPDASFRKHFIHRQGKEGFSGDIARNFATLSISMANQLSRLKYFAPITNAVGSAQAELKGNPNKDKLSDFVEEMRLRAESELMPASEDTVGNRIANFANKAAFLYMMTNVKTAVAQLSAVPMFVGPVLASKHGNIKTAKALGSFAAIWNSLGVRKTNPDGSVSWVAPTIAQSKRVRLNPEERRAAQYMIDRGISENTLTYDLANLKRLPTSAQNSFPRRTLNTVVNAMSALFHHTERLIREVTFMASFRLNRAKNPKLSFEEVVRLAEAETLEALNDYSASNRPRGIGATAEREVFLDARKPFGRAVLQFKMFPAFVTTYFFRNLWRMMGSGYSKEERKKAFTQFFGTLGMSYALGGVMGIPGFSFAFGILSGLRHLTMGDDEDDPLEKRDLEFWFRNVWLPDTFGEVKLGGKPLSDWLDRGVVAGITGYDITSSLSLNNMWFPDQKESASAQEGALEMFASIMGPFVGLAVKQLPKAIDLLNQGKIMEGMEQLMPAMVRSPLTAYRYSKEGAYTSIGAPIKEAEQFTLGQLMGQALGFSTEGLVARREDLFKYNSIRMQVETKKRELLDRIDLDMRKGDDIDSAIERILKFNNKNWFNPIDFDSLSQSLQKRMERRMMSERGLPIEEKYYPQLQQLFAPSLRKLEAEAK